MHYSDKVLKLFKNPHNIGLIKNPSGIGKVGNVYCGDLLWIYIKVNKNKEGEKIIKNISFKSLGCVANIVTSSIVTDLARGKTIEKAIKITKDDVLKKIGKIPPQKVHCSILATDGLREAIYDYLSKNNLKIPKNLEENHERLVKELKEIERRYKSN